jgi:hypothetical protein
MTTLQRCQYVVVMAKETQGGKLTTQNDPHGRADVAAILLRERDFRKLLGVVNAAKAYVKDYELSIPIDRSAKRLLTSLNRLNTE